MTGPTAYARLRSDRKCVVCKAGLWPEDGARCETCREANSAAVARYRGTDKGARAQELHLARRPKDIAAKSASAFRAEQRRRGRCTVCVSLAAPGRRQCNHHIEQVRRSHARRLARKRLGLEGFLLWFLWCVLSRPSRRRRTRRAA